MPIHTASTAPALKVASQADHGDTLLVTHLEAARLLQIHEATLREWWRLGLGPARIQLGRRVMYSVRDLERWIDKNRRQPEDRFLVRKSRLGIPGTPPSLPNLDRRHDPTPLQAGENRPESARRAGDFSRRSAK